MGKFHWVSDDVKIDFKISVVMKNTMEEAEQLDLGKVRSMHMLQIFWMLWGKKLLLTN